MSSEVKPAGSLDPEFGIDAPTFDDDELAALIEAAEAGDEHALEILPSDPLPVLAVIGRPNVGKSTLVNRILGRREAVVEDLPGVTRDRVSYDAIWNGRRFTLVDTGGWDPDAEGMRKRITMQAELAVSLADAILFVVDATVGMTDHDEAVVRILRASGKPIVLAANKVDGPSAESDATALWSLGIGEPIPVSALHGRGSGDLLDAALKRPARDRRRRPRRHRRPPPRRAAGQAERRQVEPAEPARRLRARRRRRRRRHHRRPRRRDDRARRAMWKFVDTAGIRRKVSTASGHEYFASLRTAAALEKAEVAVVLIEAHESITEQDTRIISMVVESGRALVIAYNKWDLIDDERHHYLEREIERDLVRVPWAPRVNIAAKTGRHMDKLVPAIETALESWDTRIPTGRLNAFFGDIVAAKPHPVRGGKQPRILFATQASTRPPRFVIFASGFLEASYRRFLERRLREEFGFAGTPIDIAMRVREKRKR